VRDSSPGSHSLDRAVRLIWQLSIYTLFDLSSIVARSKYVHLATVANSIRTELTFRRHKCEVIPTAARLDGFLLAVTIYQISESRV
jgi:hypothetical protein